MNKQTPATLPDINRVEFNGEPVLTTAQLADAYGVTADVLYQNFKRNRERFIEGKHFFRVEGDALTNLRLTNCQVQIPEKARVLYLWTKRGAARHCKSVGTEIAWNVFEALEDNYFDRTADKPLRSVTDFMRGVELAKLAPHAKDPAEKRRIVAKAANLILGENFIDVPQKSDAYQEFSLFF